MWIVVIHWSYYEVDIHEFEFEKEARRYYDQWEIECPEKIYLAKVEETKER